MLPPALSQATKRLSIYPGWWAVLLSFLILFQATGSVYYSFGVFADSFAHEFAASRTSINLVLTLVTLLSGLAGIPIAWLLKRYSFRAVVIVGLVGQSVGLALVSYVQSTEALILTYGLIIGMTEAIIGIQVTNMLVVHWFERRRGLALGIALSSASVAAIIYPPMAAALVANFGWRSTLLIYAVMLLPLVPLAWKLGQLPKTVPEREQAAKPSVAMAKPLSSILRDREFWVMSVTIGLIFSANVALLSSVVANARANGLGALAGASLLSLQGIVALFGKLMFGYLGDRLNLRLCLFAASISGTVGMALLATGSSFAAFAWGAVFLGICMGGALPLFGMIAAQSFGLSNYALVLGAARTAMMPLTMAGPLVAGLLFDRFESWRPVFAVLLVALVVAGAGSLLLRVRPRSNAPVIA